MERTWLREGKLCEDLQIRCFSEGVVVLSSLDLVVTVLLNVLTLSLSDDTASATSFLPASPTTLSTVTSLLADADSIIELPSLTRQQEKKTKRPQ